MFDSRYRGNLDKERAMFGECELCGELDELERLYAPIGKDLCKECVYSDEVQDKLREDRHR